tara:strand:+ start:78 stop:1367 length:1290 start_codon:yes stop_codon:yes gene_type:complete
MATTTSKPSKVGSNFYTTSVTTNTDGSLKATTSRTDAQGNSGVPVSSVNTTSSGQSTRTFESGATATEKTAFSNPNSPERKAYTQQVQSQNPYGANPTAEQQKAVNGAAGNPNTAPNSPTPPEQSAEAAKEAGSTKEGTRTSYATNMKYPINLQLEVQDVIKFSILEYSPSLAKENQRSGQFGSTKSRVVTLDGGIVKGSKRIGVITLPIPTGISDSNPVGWQQGDLNMLQSEAANAAKSFLEGGVDAAGSAIKGSAGTVQSNPDEVKTAATNLLIGQAVQANIASRASGAINNNNVELLFSGPSLRTFSFQFLFYPREPDEAIMVRKIIRAFKQAMSVKRSAASLLLKAPHTFAIQYLTAGQKAHPYLNRFKECALTSCNVDYTPDGTYMTYDGPEKSMTAYRLSLTFQELEPLFDDEYGSDDDNVGF